jgi:hypothetical protein
MTCRLVGRYQHFRETYCLHLLDWREIWGSHGGKEADLVFWVLMQCRLAGRHQHFRATDCLYLQGWRADTRMKMAVFWYIALCSLEDGDQTTWCYIPEDSHLYICYHENLKSHLHYSRQKKYLGWIQDTLIWIWPHGFSRLQQIIVDGLPQCNYSKNTLHEPKPTFCYAKKHSLFNLSNMEKSC